MTSTQKLIVAFWVVILLLAAWQFYTYNDKLEHPAQPTQKQFFFYPPTSKANAPVPPPPPAAGADVRQVDFSIDKGVPSTGNFTCHVTLKNLGLSKAINVQIWVRPYRGVSNFDEDGGGHQENIKPIDDDSPVARIGDFLSFPDLAPGESFTEDTVFLDRTDYRPGTNPDPQIIFQTEKAPAKASAKGGGD